MSLRESPLTVEEKVEFLRFLGLGAIQFYLTETVEGRQIRDTQFENGRRRTVYRESEPSPSAGYLSLNYKVGKREPFVQEESLWSALFPPPLGRVEAVWKKDDRVEVEANPPLFFAGFSQLNEALVALEEKIWHTEFGCLCFRKGEAHFALKVRYRHHRRGQISRCYLPEALLSAPSASRETLEAHFGGRASLISLQLPTERAFQPAELAEHIHQNLQAPSQFLGGLEGDSESPGFELGL